MKITKIGHSALIIEERGVRILLDPGSYSDNSAIQGTVDVLLITHEHEDHCHLASVRELFKQNPRMAIVTHEGVGKLLTKEQIPFRLIADGEEQIYGGVAVQSFGTEHACIHHDLPKVQNTGFFIAQQFFYPGDAFHDPRKTVGVLALPVAGPWMKIAEAIEYAKALKPKAVFPVHDGMLRPERVGATRRIPKAILEPFGISFVDMVEGSVSEF